MTGPLYLCSLLLVLGGVFGDTDEVKTETVMEGDSLTLQINAAEIQGATDLWWRFKDEIIAKIDKEQGSAPKTYDKRFPDRLKLDDQTGSLTITDSKTTDSGLYKLEIKSSKTKYKTFNVAVRKVNRVMEGDSVTLHTGVKIQSGDVIEWMFKGNIIATLTGPVDDAGFRNSEVNEQTGDLTITKIRRDQFGDYEVKINSRGLISHRTFSVIVREVITVMEGESVTLQTDVKIHKDDVIQWKFNKTIIADLKGHVHDAGFSNSEVNKQTGDLIITNITRDQFGDYEMKIYGRRLQKIFSVNAKVIPRNAYREETYPALLIAVILLGIINTFMNE